MLDFASARNLKEGTPMASRTTRTPKKDRKFLEFLSQGASVSAAARASGYTRSRLYEWRRADPAFASAWSDSLGRGTDLLEDEALHRAKDGVDEPRFYQGQLCGHVRKYSDTLLIFLLKARRPEKYGDKAQAEHAGHITVRWLEEGEEAPAPHMKSAPA
jgi:hypothetical protein